MVEWQYQLLLLILMLLMTTMFIWQLYSKKFNFAGVLALFGGLGFIILNIYMNTMDALILVLFTTGVILIIIELFVVGAILGLLGIGCIIASFMLVGDNMWQMLMFVSISILVGLIEWLWIKKVLKRKMPLLSEIVLLDSTNKASGYTSHDDRSYLINQVAETMTELRPAGIIKLSNERIDAVSNGSFIKRGVQVKIIYVEGTRVVVEEITE